MLSHVYAGLQNTGINKNPSAGLRLIVITNHLTNMTHRADLTCSGSDVSHSISYCVPNGYWEGPTKSTGNEHRRFNDVGYRNTSLSVKKTPISKTSHNIYSPGLSVVHTHTRTNERTHALAHMHARTHARARTHAQTHTRARAHSHLHASTMTAAAFTCVLSSSSVWSFQRYTRLSFTNEPKHTKSATEYRCTCKDISDNW